ncbi:13 TM domain-containing transmembrane protein [Acrasis kona]|uniref:Molybdate-anion transporter n=1 Tax=Acrasis kona TaxID=1008807 RepID=A0AAW2ZNL9_9EUKA
MFNVAFAALSLVCVILVLYNRSKQTIPATSGEFKRFQLIYLVPFFLMTASDWLQGPFVYVLYESYNYGIEDIGLLFTAGFGSSMIFGTFVGSLCDRFGRKNCCLVYVVLYTISCITKHFSNFSVLMLGRLLGGISTSILFSAFESWMISEHFSRGFDSEWLSYTFYLQSFGNSIVAILSGIAGGLVKSAFGTVTAPFDAAVILLIIGGVAIALLWKENYGDSTGEFGANFVNAYNAIKNDANVLCLGVAQSFFESAMYIFVFMWTPTIAPLFEEELNHGLIFACFMVAAMIGSSVYNLTSTFYAKEAILSYMFLVSALSFVGPIAINNREIIVSSFLLFEGSVGVFWPSISTLKGIYIPEDVRGTVMNYFRLPTNFFVVIILNQVKKLSTPIVYTLCAAFMAVGFLASYYVKSRAEERNHISRYSPVVVPEVEVEDRPSQETHNA